MNLLLYRLQNRVNADDSTKLRNFRCNPQNSSQEVRKAYLDLVKRWHPDSQFARTSSVDAQEHFLKIQAAYEQIKIHRESFTEEPVKPPKPSPSASAVSQNLTAEVLYESATEFGKSGLYREAIAELSLAIRLDPSYRLAYQYRGHLNSLLGLENQAEADLNKADLLKRLGASATHKTQAEIEILARESPRAKPRSHFQSYVTRKKWTVTVNQFMVGVILMIIGGVMLNRFWLNPPSRDFPSPFEVDSQATES